MGKISFRYCEDYKKSNIMECLKNSFSDIGALEKYIRPKSKVLLKCDLSGAQEPDIALTTHPNLVAVIADMIDKIGASCVIVDSPKEYSASNVEKMYEVTKMLEVSNRGHAQLNNNFDLSREEISGKKTTKLTLLNAIKNSDVIINIPKLVVDEKDGFKGCTYNLLGLIASEEQYIFHQSANSSSDFADYLLDVYGEVKDKLVLNIVDGIVARESNNCQRILNLIAVGENALELDYALLKIVNMNQDENALIKRAKYFKLLPENVQSNLVGDNQELFIRKDFSTPNLDDDTVPTTVSRDYLNIQERPKVVINECKGCKTCFSCCPTNAISEGKDENGEIFARIDLLKCIHCMNCIKTCPYSAIKTVTPPKAKKLKQKMNKRLVNKN